MKAVVVIAFMLATAGRAAYAQEPVSPDVEILSVVPRSPDVKPYVMALPAEGRPRPPTGSEKQLAAKPANGETQATRQTTVAQEK